MTTPFDPLAIENLGFSITRALFETDPTPLGGLSPFTGAGLYAIFYRGPHPAYKELTKANANSFNQPIYVGKAVPSGSRKGILAPGNTRVLYQRLSKHRRSIEAVTNLEVESFAVRYLVVEPIWIPLGESILISRTGPVWNRLVDGFGSNAPGKGRHKGLRPRWDVLHPGRPEMEMASSRTESMTQIESEVTEYLRSWLN